MGGLKNFGLRLRRSPHVCLLYPYTWAPTEKFPHHKKKTIFWRAEVTNQFYSVFFFDDFRPWYMYVLRAPEARAKSLWCFVGRQHIWCHLFSNSMGGSKYPLATLCGAHGHILTTPNKRLNWNSTRKFLQKKIVPNWHFMLKSSNGSTDGENENFKV